MKRTLVTLRNSKASSFLERNQKYLPILFFTGGFVFDSLTLGRVDRLYDLVVLSMHMSSLTVALYLFNLADDGKWQKTILGRFEKYFPYAIQFFFGALSSAYVIYFSRSVSVSKTASFFIILVVLLFANEFLKKRISNKYLQFGLYSFVSFTFFAFMLPVFIKEMNTRVFIFSGLISLGATLILMTTIYSSSPSTRAEVSKRKLISLALSVYVLMNVFYFFNLIPPVPLALDAGLVAHDIKLEDGRYVVTYEKDDWYVIWRRHSTIFHRNLNEPVYIFSSIFAPTDIKKSIFHRWKRYNQNLDEWVKMQDIGYQITGGRDGGFRGYTYKNNVTEGNWRVEVITEEELVLGVIDFEIVNSSDSTNSQLAKARF
ncbi:MAG: DUF2914 domain-containing protein [Cyclobacteriaceae bacterium]